METVNPLPMPNPRDVLPYVWMLQSVPVKSVNNEVFEMDEEEDKDSGVEEETESEEETETEDENEVDEEIALIGGAMCVHSDGVLMTVTHGIKPECNTFREFPRVFARDYKSETLREVEWVHGITCSSYGISFFKLKKESAHETFECMSTLDGVELEMEKEIFAFVHYDKLPFSINVGKVAYPFLDNIRISKDKYPSITTSLSMLEDRTNTSIQLWNYMDTTYVSKYPNVCKMVGMGLIDSFEDLHPQLPFVQVSGLGPSTMDGQCGCPVFTSEGNELVGLIALSIGYFQFIIPTAILREVLAMNLPLIQEHVSVMK